MVVIIAGRMSTMVVIVKACISLSHLLIKIFIPALYYALISSVLTPCLVNATSCLTRFAAQFELVEQNSMKYLLIHASLKTLKQPLILEFQNCMFCIIYTQMHARK